MCKEECTEYQLLYITNGEDPWQQAVETEVQCELVLSVCAYTYVYCLQHVTCEDGNGCGGWNEADF